MEEGIFPQPAVADVLESNFVEARLHNDGHDAELKASIQQLQQELTGSFAAPIYLIVDPESGKERARRDGAMRDAASFAAWLQSGLQ